MFTLKKISIYFLILLFLIGINLFKNIYIENKVNNQLQKKGMKQISFIDCHGFVNVDCQLKDVFFEKNITGTTYSISMVDLNILDFNVFKNHEKINNFKLVVNNMIINDSRNAFIELKKPMDLNVTLISTQDFSKLNVSLLHEELGIDIGLTFKDNEALLTHEILNTKVEVRRENNVIKKIIYEIYKVKLLEIIENDDEDFSVTRGMNIPLGIDTNEVIPQDIFLGEPYASVSILLRSEIETFDFLMEYHENTNVSNFISDVINKNGVNKLQIQKEKEDKS